MGRPGGGRGPGRALTYAELAARVDGAATALSGTRTLVLLAAENSVSWLVTYLAALQAGHVVLLAPGDRPAHLDGLVRAYRPGVVAARGADGWAVTSRTAGRHRRSTRTWPCSSPTSGSTGSPKLVRLSHDNLESNARSIVDALSLTDRDRAMATLPGTTATGCPWCTATWPAAPASS